MTSRTAYPHDTEDTVVSSLDRRRNSAGVTLVEVLLVLAVSTIVIGPLTVWVVLAMREQVNTTRTNLDTSGLGKANVYFPRDVTNSSRAVVLTSAQISAGVTLPDCSGGSDGSQASGTVMVRAR